MQEEHTEVSHRLHSANSELNKVRDDLTDMTARKQKLQSKFGDCESNLIKAQMDIDSLRMELQQSVSTTEDLREKYSIAEGAALQLESELALVLNRYKYVDQQLTAAKKNSGRSEINSLSGNRNMLMLFLDCF